MHYYSFNIGDYASHTRNLSLLEDLAYRRLLDEYYLHEHPLNVSVTAVARQIGMREHEDCIKFILDSFFILTESGWINTRADREIEHFKGKIAQASNAGKASAERRLNVRSTGVQPNNKQEPITNKQETNKTIKEKKSATSAELQPLDVSDEVWQDFLIARKAKKQAVTKTALNGIRNEADKAGWSMEAALSQICLRGWGGFKADWVANQQPRSNTYNQPQTPSKTMQGIMLLQQEIDRLNNEGTENEILEN